MATVEDPEGAAERRARITADLAEKTGIDDAMIERLVRTFYARVQEDPLIGPVFAMRIHDWEALTEVADFDAEYLQIDVRPEQRMRMAEAC